MTALVLLVVLSFLLPGLLLQPLHDLLLALLTPVGTLLVVLLAAMLLLL